MGSGTERDAFVNRTSGYSQNIDNSTAFLTLTGMGGRGGESRCDPAFQTTFVANVQKASTAALMAVLIIVPNILVILLTLVAVVKTKGKVNVPRVLIASLAVCDLSYGCK